MGRRAVLVAALAVGLLSPSSGCSRGPAETPAAGGEPGELELRPEPKAGEELAVASEPRAPRSASRRPVLEPEPPPPYAPRACRPDETDYGDSDLLCDDCDPEVELDDGGVDWLQWREEQSIERITRACLCSITGCPPLEVTAAEADRVKCGCGKIEVYDLIVLSSRTYVYDQQTLELVAGRAHTDQSWYCGALELTWNDASLADCPDYADCDPSDFVELCPAQE